MEFGMEKCVIPIMKSGEREITEGIKLPNLKRIRMFGEKENYKYWEMLEVHNINQAEI